jgi:hypothetical protein
MYQFVFILFVLLTMSLSICVSCLYIVLPSTLQGKIEHWIKLLVNCVYLIPNQIIVLLCCLFNLIISSPGPNLKVHVNYCHHLASVVCKLFTFQASSPTLQGQLEPNLAGMFLGWSSTKFLFFVPVGYSTWLPGPIMCSDWLKFKDLLLWN